MPVPYGRMLHIPPTNLLLLTAKQEPYKIRDRLFCMAPVKKKTKLKNFLEKAQENGPAGRKKDKTERVTGLGRKTRE